VRTTYLVHIVAGSLGLILGYLALYAPKGAGLHRRTGMGFVYAMLILTLTGITIALVKGVAPAVNVPAGLLTAYLVTTSLTTVRPLGPGSRALEVTAMLVAGVVAVASFSFGVEALAGGGRRNGIPAFPFFMFGVVGLVGVAGDVGMIRSGSLRGAPRLARHLWRMCFALFIAGIAFFPRLPRLLPTVFTIPGLIAIPLLAVVVTMAYWLWRVRIRRNLRGIAALSVAEVAPGVF
jgi:hypothetical protein